MPLFSIIIPVYNNEKYFPIAVNSVLQQSFKDIELIIVDDGSTDKTSEIADTFAQKDKRVKVIHQDNQWIYASCNNGISKAQGDYIFIVNSDDSLMENALQILADKVNQYHPDVIWTKVLVHICDKMQKILQYDYRGLDKKSSAEIYYSNKTEVRKNWLFLMESELACNQINLYKRELMQKYPFRNDYYGADQLFNISIANDVNKALIIKEPIYNHFYYQSDKLNVSYGKYYDYTHDMFNEFYKRYMNLFQEWKIPFHEYVYFFGQQRMKDFTYQIRTLSYSNCPLNIEQKLRCIFEKYLDETMIRCAKSIKAEEELESRVLSGVRELLLKDSLSETSEMFFVYELVDGLLKYEKDDEDLKKIERAIHHPMNTAKIGKIFYEKIKK